jgi:glutaredoxin
MPHRRPAPTPASPLRRCGPALLLALLATPVLAQGVVYRSVGPDGRVSFSDQPPAADATPARPQSGPAAAGNPAVPLPFELRQVVARYPVTLHTAPGCAPCERGRQLLDARGVPYVEKTVTTAQDGEALQRLSGDSALPFLSIGSQPLTGYSETEWTRFLDAAGYPRQSVLPPGYRRAAPVPLVTAQVLEVPAPAPASAQRPPAVPAAVPVAPPAANPAGIRF